MMLFINRRWTLLNNKRRYIYRHMPRVSYFSLNKFYFINTMFVFVTFLVVILWLHLRLHANVMTELGEACNDPIASFFNKKIAQRCYIDTITNSATWVDKNLENIVKTLDLQQNATNARILGLYKMYDERNKLRADAYIKRIDDKKRAFDDLQTSVDNIKSGIQENDKSIKKLMDDYKDVILGNVNNLRSLASNIVDKLKQKIYTPNYGDQRQKFVETYEKIDKYFNVINNDGILGTKIDKLAEISYEARNGRV
jgi:hypothetical protein